MKFDIEASLGILSAVSILTCAGCTKESGRAKAQVVPTNAEVHVAEKHPDLIFSSKGSDPTKSKPGHAAHSAHMSHSSHSSHSSSRY